MADATLAELYASALAEAGGSSTSVVLPDGRFRVRLVSKKGGSSKQGGKPQYGLRFVVLEGPYEGQTTWVNQTLTVDNKMALGIWLRLCIELGVDEAFVRSGQVAPHELPNYIVKGTEGWATFGNHAYGSDPASGQPKLHQDLKKFEVTGVPQQVVSAAGTPVIPSTPVAVVAAPVAPVIPVAAPVYSVPAPAPVAAPAPAVVAAVQTIAASMPVPVVAVPPLPQAPSVPAAPAGTAVVF